MLAARDTTARILAIRVAPRRRGYTTDTLGRNGCDCKRQIDRKPLKIEQSWIVRCYHGTAACAAFASAPRRHPRLRGVPLEDRGCSPNGTPLPIADCPLGSAVAPRKRRLLARDTGVKPPCARSAESHSTKIGSSVIAARRTVGAPQPVLPPFRRTRPCSSRGTGLSIK